jgi:hypothetical protein
MTGYLISTTPSTLRRQSTSWVRILFIYHTVGFRRGDVVILHHHPRSPCERAPMLCPVSHCSRRRITEHRIQTLRKVKIKVERERKTTLYMALTTSQYLHESSRSIYAMNVPYTILYIHASCICYPRLHLAHDEPRLASSQVLAESRPTPTREWAVNAFAAGAHGSGKASAWCWRARDSRRGGTSHCERLTSRSLYSLNFDIHAVTPSVSLRW